MGLTVVRVSENGDRTTFQSINGAASASGVPPTTLKYHLKSKKQKLLGGYAWECGDDFKEVPGPMIPGASEAAGLLEALRTEDGRLITEMRLGDGYINATKMCHNASSPGRSKEWSTYLQNQSTVAFLEELETCLGYPRNMLVQSIIDGPNAKRGTWVHPDVAIHLAQW
jgi:hypothetical protein